MITVNKALLKILQSLFYIFPVCFIFGNPAINLALISIILVGFIYYKKNILKDFNKKILFLFVSFFIVVLLSSYINYFFIEANKDAIKSILYLRYLLFLFVIRALIINRHININYFLSICFLLSFLIALDILIQSLIGKNIIGNNIIEFPGGITYHTGVFGDELIAGSFLLTFSTIGIFSIFNLLKIEKKLINLIIFFTLILFFLISILLSGNRMPLLMFLIFLVFLGLIYKKKEKLYFFSFATIVSILLSFLIINSENLIKRAGNFIVGIPNPIIIIEELKKEYPNLKKYESSGIQFHNLEEFKSTKNSKVYPFFTGHLSIYITSIDLFLDKPIVGGGIKSFRNNCHNKIHLPNRVCENHPHNYILEILNDTGLIGLTIIFCIVSYLLLNNYKDYKFSEPEKSKISNWIYLAIILSILIQFFPFKSTGSFFSTFNSSFIFLILGISIGLNDLKYEKRP